MNRFVFILLSLSPFLLNFSSCALRAERVSSARTTVDPGITGRLMNFVLDRLPKAKTQDNYCRIYGDETHALLGQIFYSDLSWWFSLADTTKSVSLQSNRTELYGVVFNDFGLHAVLLEDDSYLWRL